MVFLQGQPMLHRTIAATMPAPESRVNRVLCSATKSGRRGFVLPGVLRRPALAPPAGPERAGELLRLAQAAIESRHGPRPVLAVLVRPGAQAQGVDQPQSPDLEHAGEPRRPHAPAP